MSTDVTTRPLRSALVTVALLAAALLAFAVLVQRVAAVRLHFHGDLLLLGNGLLGIGIAGSVLAMFERSWRLLPEAWSQRTCLGFLVSLPVAWAWMAVAPVPMTLAGAGDWLSFAGFAVAAALPFAFGGGAIGVLLASNARSVHSAHGAELLGAAVAAGAVPFVLWNVGVGGTFLATLVLATAACAAAGPIAAATRAMLIVGGAAAGLWMPAFEARFPIDAAPEVEVAAGRTLALEAPIHTRWSVGGRVDICPLAKTEEPAPVAVASPAGEVAAVAAVPPVRQWWLARDGGAGVVLRDYWGSPAAAAALLQGGHGAALHLLAGQNAKVAILGLGGGADAFAARQSDAVRIRVFEGDAGIVEAHRRLGDGAAEPLFTDPRIEVVGDDGRAALMRSDERFDLIQTTVDDTRTSMSAPTMSLAADHRFTVDALRTALLRLTDGGLLQIARASHAPATIRLLNNLYHAYPEAERAAFPSCLAVLHDAHDDRVFVLTSKAPFANGTAARLRAFVAAAGFEGIVLPDSDLRAQVAAEEQAVRAVESELARLDAEIGKRTEGVDDKELQRLRAERARAELPLPRMRTRLAIAGFVVAADKHEFAVAFGRDIAPTTDDRPWFHAFGPLGAEARDGGPDDVGGRLVQMQLLIGMLIAGVFLLLPMLFRGGAVGGSRDGALRFLVYFTASGAGTLAMAVAIVQRCALLLGPPQYSVAVTLAALLSFAALGAFASNALLGWEPERGRFVALLLFVLAAVIAFLSPAVVDLCIGLSLPWRMAVVALLAAPPGLLLGMPLPHGVRTVERTNPSLVPWSLAVTATGLGLGALGTVAVSMAFGFGAVLFGAGVLFLVAFAAIDGLARSESVAADVDDDGSVTDGVAAT